MGSRPRADLGMAQGHSWEARRNRPGAAALDESDLTPSAQGTTRQCREAFFDHYSEMEGVTGTQEVWPGMLANSYCAQDSPHNEELSGTNANRAEVETPQPSLKGLVPGDSRPSITRE